MTRQKSFLSYAAVTVPVTLGVGFLMGQLSNSGYGNDWFDGLIKPAAMPPGWMFGAAWSLLYILLGLSLALILQRKDAPGRGLALGLFAAQMVLNYSWSPLFFGMHQARTALIVLLAIFALSMATTVLFGRIDRKAALLMVPYLAWLSFASYLNYEIVRLNGL